ncbi:hypothetical protein [Blastococcus sp. SYSU DS0973]
MPALRPHYPHVVAGAIGAQLTDVTCGGADTGDFFAEQHPGVAPSSTPSARTPSWSP